MNIKLPFKSTSELDRNMFQLLERNEFHACQLTCSHDPSPQLDAEKRSRKVTTNFQSKDELLDSPRQQCEGTCPRGGRAQWSARSVREPGVTFRPAYARPWPCASVTAARKCAKIIIYLIGLSETFLGDLYEDYVRNPHTMIRQCQAHKPSQPNNC